MGAPTVVSLILVEGVLGDAKQAMLRYKERRVDDLREATQESNA